MGLPFIVTYHLGLYGLQKSIEIDHSRVDRHFVRPYPPLDVPSVFAAKTDTRKRASKRNKRRKSWLRNVFNLLADSLHHEILVSLLSAAAVAPRPWHETPFKAKGFVYHFCGFLPSGEPLIYNRSAVEANIHLQQHRVVDHFQLSDSEESESDSEAMEEIRPRFGPEVPPVSGSEDEETPASPWSPQESAAGSPFTPWCEEEEKNEKSLCMLWANPESEVEVPRKTRRKVRMRRIHHYVDVSAKWPKGYLKPGESDERIELVESDEGSGDGSNGGNGVDSGRFTEVCAEEPDAGVGPGIKSPTSLVLSAFGGGLPKEKGPKRRKHGGRRKRAPYAAPRLAKRTETESTFFIPTNNSGCASSAAAGFVPFL